MRKLLLRYFVLFVLACIVSCTPPVDSTPSSTFSCGVLSSKAENISAQELTLKVRFFVLEGEESDQLTKKINENKLTLWSSDVVGTLLDNREVTTPSSGNYSCAILLDKVYNIINYDFDRKLSPTEFFLRKFLKNQGVNNSFLFSSLETKPPNVSFYGKGFTSNYVGLDLTLARLLNNVEEPTEKIRKLPLLQGIDILLDTIYRNGKGNNRNLLLIYSRTSYLNSGITKDSVINKAKRLGIKVSTIMDKGGEYDVDYDLANDDLFFKIADITGGFVYKDNDYISYFDKLILASRLSNILEGNFKCFESTWKIVPEGIRTDPFQSGFYAEGNLKVDLGTQFLSNVIELPFIINLK